MSQRPGACAGCAWLVFAVLMAGAAYWGLGLAGPSAWPTLLVMVVISASLLALAIALWIGFGGRRTAALSLGLGVLVAALSLADPWGSDPGVTSANVGGGLVGLAIVLASWFAWAKRPSESVS